MGPGWLRTAVGKMANFCQCRTRAHFGATVKRPVVTPSDFDSLIPKKSCSQQVTVPSPDVSNTQTMPLKPSPEISASLHHKIGQKPLVILVVTGPTSNSFLLLSLKTTPSHPLASSQRVRIGLEHSSPASRSLLSFLNRTELKNHREIKLEKG